MTYFNYDVENDNEYMNILRIIYGVKDMRQIKFKDNDRFNLTKDNIIIITDNNN